MKKVRSNECLRKSRIRKTDGDLNNLSREEFRSNFRFNLPKIGKGHSALNKSTRLIKKMILIPSKETSPEKDLSRSHNKIDQISEILESCERISKVNKNDISLTGSLRKHNEATFNEIKDYINTQNLKSDLSRWVYQFKKRKLRQNSIERIKKESFETTYFVERKLNKYNSIKKIKAKLMPWKKLI